MKALYFDGGGNVRLSQIETPRPRDNEALVRIRACGVCQTEYRKYLGDGSPNLLGHEFSGVIVETGPRVRRLKPGDRVCCYPFTPCHACSVCRSGLEQVCPNRGTLAGNPLGGFAEFIALPEENLLPLADDIDDPTGVLLLDSFGMMWNGMSRVPVTPASTIAIFGMQPYGLGGVCIAKRMGARVIAFDASPLRRALAERMGADMAIDSRGFDEPAMRELTGGEKFEHIIECDDPAVSFENLFQWIRPGGSLCLMGHSLRTFEMRPNWVTLWEVRVIGSPLYNPRDHYRIMELARRCPQARGMITHFVRLEDAKSALDEYVAGNAGKVVFDLSD